MEAFIHHRYYNQFSSKSLENTERQKTDMKSARKDVDCRLCRVALLPYLDARRLIWNSGYPRHHHHHQLWFCFCQFIKEQVCVKKILIKFCNQLPLEVQVATKKLFLLTQINARTTFKKNIQFANGHNLKLRQKINQQIY